jgi:hypothetical protein
MCDPCRCPYSTSMPLLLLRKKIKREEILVAVAVVA